MPQDRDPIHEVCNAVSDGLRQIGDFSYAILPKNMAHTLADFKKAVLTELTSALQCQIEWIDNRVAGGDRLRERWRERCERTASADPSTGSTI